MTSLVSTPCPLSVTTREGLTLSLQARFCAGSTGCAVVAPPHPLYGGTIDNPVVVAIGAALRRSQVATLSFNFRGVEASEGELSGSLDNAVEDYSAALAELTRRSQGPTLVTGYSFGAGTALLCARDQPAVHAALLVAPPVGMLHGDDLRAFSGKLAIIVGSQDEYAPLPELKQVLSARPDAALFVLQGETHFFHYGGLADLERKVAEQVGAWLSGT